MKRFFAFCLSLMVLLSLPSLSVLAEDNYYGVTVKEGDTFVDFSGITDIQPEVVRQMLAAYPTIEKIDMYEAKLSTQEMLSLFDEYRQVDFGFTIKISEHTIRTDATAFSTLHSKYDPRHTTEELMPLRMCRHLKALDIGHNSVDNVDWLVDLPNIRILIIALNKITDISVLSNLKDLEYLEMFTNKIVDISPLLECKKLLDLNIGFNRIEDISPLYEMHQLERLWMYSYRYVNQDTTTPEIRQKLKEALPNCQFNFHNYPTLAGWREHQRYYVLYEVFKTGVWLPWDAEVPIVKGK